MESIVVGQVVVEVVDLHERLQHAHSVVLWQCFDWLHRFSIDRMDIVCLPF